MKDRIIAISIALGLMGSITIEDAQAAQADANEVIEEQVVLGRFLGSSQALLLERQEDEAIVDTLDADSISRMGDSTVAAALRRVTGLSLIDNQFVYVRGLGERYSATTLNGAYIPSPDLSRNVVPLDLFPSSVVESLAVKKTFTPDISANFAGGLIDIRTTPFPDKGFNFSAELGSGANFETDSSVYSYNGGSDDRFGTDDGTRALSSQILARLDQFKGAASPQAVYQLMARANPGTATLADAKAINLEMASALNRDISVEEKDGSPDMGGKVSIGSTFDFSDSVVLGVQISGAHDSQWRERVTNTFDSTFPTEQFATRNESTFSVNITGTATAGLRFMNEHDLSFSSIFLRNTDDETSVTDGFDENREKSDGSGNRVYSILFEEREMTVNQFRGNHVFGANTKELLPFDFLDWVSDDASIDWFWSEAEATTAMPNEISAAYATSSDKTSGEVLSAGMSVESSAVDFRFTDLEDEVLSYGWTANLPIEVGSSSINVRFGYKHDQKARVYEQREFGLGPTTNSSGAILSAGIGEILSDANLANADYGFEFNVQGAATRSYLAATMTDANFAVVDWNWNETITVSVGGRDEYYRQVALPWNISGYTFDQPQMSNNLKTLQAAAFEDKGFFPAASLVYRSSWIAEIFQLRFGLSETAIRPDLREVMDATYIDPATGELVYGNTDVVPAASTNLDLRADWFFDNGNSFTLSLFNKEIDDPIEFFEKAASDTNTAREIVNAESTSITGLELEGLYELGALGAWGETLFVKGNATFQESETTAGVRADAPTNNIRPASGASDYVINFMVGYDSQDGRHMGSIMFNVFGERLYTAGRNGAEDLYEQPFRSFDATYGFYPTENLTLKVKLMNLFDEAISIERDGVLVFEEKPGMAISASAKYDF